MNSHTFYIVDVFAERRYAGNQLAVFREAGDISDAEMQQIAREINFSETTFILSDEERDGGWDVRIFSPRAELPFAGHPTAGTAYVIQQEIIQKPVERIALNLKVGQIPVTFHYRNGQVDEVWMKQINPSFGGAFEPGDIAPMLGLEAADIDNRFPLEEVSTGVYCLIVSLKTLEAVKRARVDKDQYFQWIQTAQAKLVLVFCPETYYPENTLNVRVFADYYGVPEDPATGAANGCLAGYLVKNRYFGDDKIDIRIEQGYEIGRPSLLLLKAEEKGGEIDIFVGGQVVMIAKGVWS